MSEGTANIRGVLLRDVIAATGISQSEVARRMGRSGAALSLLIRRGEWPKQNPSLYRSLLRDVLLGAGTEDARITAAFEQLDAPSQGVNIITDKEFWMIRKQILHPGARRKFGLHRDPFSDDFSCAADVFYSPDTRYVLESLYQLAKHGGMSALIGESGSGKTTLRRALIERLKAEEARVIVIEPYTLGMDNGNKKIPGLRASHICEAVLAELDPDFRTTSAEARMRRMHKRLVDSSRAGWRHLLILEEAHSLPLYTVKHLKRFAELTDGLTRLMSILLIGQPELRTNKLMETNAEVREVVQRMEILELYPLDDLEGYVRHRLDRVNAKFDDVFAPDALPALTLRLTGPSPKGRAGSGTSLLFPLLVNNMLTKAINTATELKMPKVDAGIIQQA